MFFETAGITVAFWIPPLVAFAISFFTSMGGVSGAFLLLPFQMSVLGYVNPSVSATNQLYNIVAIPGGIYRYWKEKRMVWPLAWTIIVGTLPGVFIGVIVRISYLPDPKNFKLFAAFVLLYIGYRLVRDLLRKNKPNSARDSEKRFRELAVKFKDKSESSESHHAVKIVSFDRRRLVYTFYDERFDISFWGIAGLSFAVGIVGGIYGIGGGAIMAPILVTAFGLPVYTVAGPALMGTFVTSIAGVAFYQAMAPLYPGMSVAPDWMLGILFGIGGLAGIYLGARCQKYVPAKAIKWMLAMVILFTAAKYVIGFVAG